ncbi:hypothetical protein GCM10010178_84470 [Lentzea flava]|uniref:Pentapeptide repeat-containing protein n=1 Tax=Lentzea flava TaxID=103732 RepID=A0ABQ2VFU1_9PSEU|nr:Pentapeptide repeat-containing protein [Lentzea flava]GGU80842.1 hypothetical protein GCM10010178_84470 [Lentzea flava]
MAVLLAIALLTAAVVTVLWWPVTNGLTGKDLVSARLEALRVGLSVGLGGGGLFALYLAWRRQRSTEADLDNRERALAHQLQVAEATERDAEARRITDLYTKAVEQLGSDKAPVRLGGLYALERLAQDNPGQRQTIVNVWCAYLRMPFTPPEKLLPGPDADEKVLLEHRERVQEREVRLTAQRLLVDHLRTGPDEDRPVSTYWADIDVDLTGAALVDFRFDRCQVRNASFQHAVFAGLTVFSEATFTGDARFISATFADPAEFVMTTFGGYAFFTSVTFAGRAHFSWVTFTSSASFDEAAFTGDTTFDQVKFDELTEFRGAAFTGPATFRDCSFTERPDRPDFRSVTFTHGIPSEVEQYHRTPDEAELDDIYGV